MKRNHVKKQTSDLSYFGNCHSSRWLVGHSLELFDLVLSLAFLTPRIKILLLMHLKRQAL